MGIRVALGARSGDMLWMVLRETLSLALAGVVIGVPLAMAGTRLLSNVLFGVASSDVLTFSSVILVMLAVSVMAGYVLARRATKVDPIVALRRE